MLVNILYYAFKRFRLWRLAPSLTSRRANRQCTCWTALTPIRVNDLEQRRG